MISYNERLRILDELARLTDKEMIEMRVRLIRNIKIRRETNPKLKEMYGYRIDDSDISNHPPLRSAPVYACMECCPEAIFDSIAELIQERDHA